MILYFIGIMALGFLVGKGWMEYKITTAAKYKKVIAISGDLYIVKQTDARRDDV